MSNPYIYFSHGLLHLGQIIPIEQMCFLTIEISSVYSETWFKRPLNGEQNMSILGQVVTCPQTWQSQSNVTYIVGFGHMTHYIPRMYTSLSDGIES